MHWFEAVAPIRQKLLVAFGLLTGLTALVALTGVVAGSWLVVGVGAAATAVSALLGTRLRALIADPYVATVERMEGLAAGDLQSPIAYLDHQDCVGRISNAMLGFRDAAVEQQRLADDQKRIVADMARGLSTLAAADLTAAITTDFPPAYAELKTNFNAAVTGLRELIGSVIESASTIRTGSVEIAAASEDLARRTEANAASLEETTAAVTQMDQRLKATAIAAGQTVERADGAIETVTSGRSIADQAVAAMTRVSESAKGIDSVIEGLDKIAFQTRVLAMNAAVEAGRAGDAGRGFAVVADLVSALAMRAEEEAKRARDQLTVTQTDIGTAVDAVTRVDGALADISTGVGEVHELLARIASDNKAQSSAITEVTAALGTMDQSTQQNAAMVEQTSAAARNLSSEASTLSDRATRFAVDGRKPGVTRAAAPAFTRSAGMSQGARVPAGALAQTKAVHANDWATF